MRCSRGQAQQQQRTQAIGRQYTHTIIIQDGRQDTTAPIESNCGQQSEKRNAFTVKQQSNQTAKQRVSKQSHYLLDFLVVVVNHNCGALSISLSSLARACFTIPYHTTIAHSFVLSHPRSMS